jgi:hypothetical protein
MWSTSCIAWASLKTRAPKLSAALIFFGYFFVSRQKSNWGLGQRPILKTNKERKDWIWRSKRTDPDLSGELSEAN